MALLEYLRLTPKYSNLELSQDQIDYICGKIPFDAGLTFKDRTFGE
jgi:hypothetical protein